MTPTEAAEDPPLIRTGISGLDTILDGGLPINQMYLVQGTPGAGKTTLGLSFLLEGLRNGERCVYIALSETREEILMVARSHGWALDGLTICEMPGLDKRTSNPGLNTMFHPAEVEFTQTVQVLLRELEQARPSRVVFDSLSELRLLAQSTLRYRRQVIGLKHFFTTHPCTVLLLDDGVASDHESRLQSVVHGVISLEQLTADFGGQRRRLRVVKLRGRKYATGFHDYLITQGSLSVFPRLVAAEWPGHFEAGILSSGLPEIDQLLGGGIHRGTSLLLTGPAGSGKSSIATRYVVSAAERGERAVIFTFDESAQTAVARARGSGMDLEGQITAGRVRLQQVDPAEFSPGEFVHLVLEAAMGGEGRETASVVVIDSLNGYLNAMPEERFLILQLHELLTTLAQHGMVTFLVVTENGVVGTRMQPPVDTSYLVDSVILTRYFEHQGEVRQALSVVKKRVGGHERTIRELSIGPDGLSVSKPLRDFRGVLGGSPARETGTVPGTA